MRSARCQQDTLLFLGRSEHAQKGNTDLNPDLAAPSGMQRHNIDASTTVTTLQMAAGAAAGNLGPRRALRINDDLRILNNTIYASKTSSQRAIVNRNNPQFVQISL